MTKENYSIQGLKDLLDELEKLEDQFEMVQEAAAYANRLKITEK